MMIIHHCALNSTFYTAQRYQNIESEGGLPSEMLPFILKLVMATVT